MPAPRDNRLEIRLTDEEREYFSAAAARAGESLSVWLRRAGRAAVLREEGQRLGILPPPRRKRG